MENFWPEVFGTWEAGGVISSTSPLGHLFLWSFFFSVEIQPGCAGSSRLQWPRLLSNQRSQRSIGTHKWHELVTSRGSAHERFTRRQVASGDARLGRGRSAFSFSNGPFGTKAVKAKGGGAEAEPLPPADGPSSSLPLLARAHSTPTVPASVVKMNPKRIRIPEISRSAVASWLEILCLMKEKKKNHV